MLSSSLNTMLTLADLLYGVKCYQRKGLGLIGLSYFDQRFGTVRCKYFRMFTMKILNFNSDGRICIPRLMQPSKTRTSQNWVLILLLCFSVKCLKNLILYDTTLNFDLYIFHLKCYFIPRCLVKTVRQNCSHLVASHCI